MLIKLLVNLLVSRADWVSSLPPSKHQSPKPGCHHDHEDDDHDDHDEEEDNEDDRNDARHRH